MWWIILGLFVPVNLNPRKRVVAHINSFQASVSFLCTLNLPYLSFLHQSFFNVFTGYRKENCPKTDQKNNDTMLESTFISDLWVTVLYNVDIHRVACSLGAITLFPLKTVRRTFSYWAIKALFYAKNFFCGTMWKENIKAEVTSLL